MQQRDRRDHRGARKIRDHARRAESEAVDDDPAEEGCQDDREEVEEHGQRGEPCAPRRDEHEPGDRELRDGVAGERDRIRDVERVEGAASHAGSRYALK